MPQLQNLNHHKLLWSVLGVCFQRLDPLLITAGRSIPLLCLEGVPGLPGEPQDEASLTREVVPSYSDQRFGQGAQFEIIGQRGTGEGAETKASTSVAMEALFYMDAFGLHRG